MKGRLVDESHSQSFSLRGHMLVDIRALARERGESMSFIVREAIRLYIDQQRRTRAESTDEQSDSAS